MFRLYRYGCKKTSFITKDSAGSYNQTDDLRAWIGTGGIDREKGQSKDGTTILIKCQKTFYSPYNCRQQKLKEE
jgi:hypothetical protein